MTFEDTWSIISHEREGGSADLYSGLPMDLVPVDENVAFEAGMMRRAGEATGLSLGDRIYLALVKTRACPVLTADKAWKTVAGERGVKVEVLR